MEKRDVGIAVADQVTVDRDQNKVLVIIELPNEYQAMLVYDTMCRLASERKLTFLTRETD